MVTNPLLKHKVNLLVTSKIKDLAKLTSDPKRAFKTMNVYMGIQTRHQHMLGISWFMREMLR